MLVLLSLFITAAATVVVDIAVSAVVTFTAAATVAVNNVVVAHFYC